MEPDENNWKRWKLSSDKDFNDNCTTILLLSIRALQVQVAFLDPCQPMVKLHGLSWLGSQGLYEVAYAWGHNMIHFPMLRRQEEAHNSRLSMPTGSPVTLVQMPEHCKTNKIDTQVSVLKDKKGTPHSIVINRNVSTLSNNEGLEISPMNVQSEQHSRLSSLKNALMRHLKDGH